MTDDKPSPARMYDYFLGGTHHLPVDRAAAARVNELVPYTREIVWENRHFLRRAVRYLAKHGIRQFIDIGAGLPTQGNVHEIAQDVAPDARVVYVDNDRTVLDQADQLLTEIDGAIILGADVRQPRSIVDSPRLREFLDLDQPVAVLMIAVLHFITDDHHPQFIADTIRDAMAPGSFLVLTHLTTDGPDPAAVARTVEVYRQASAPIVFRPRETIERYFTGLELVAPGLVRPSRWRPDPTTAPGPGWLYAGVATKRTHDTP
ncbi:SAM-dependent methyltransferase [Dactylosporangium sp. NPDC049525]|uniref:SAM-dependent methyltransferase n=1 Tax=Dactylosporangium sp. NPDC049525 TaxID=3154730 RepID=UPI003446803B